MPARPTPLITKGHGFVVGPSKSPFSPLPSELPRTPIMGHFDGLKSRDDAMKTPISPPTAYTEFLKNTMNSPALAISPARSLPYSPASHSAGPYYRSPTSGGGGGYYTPATPYPAPLSAPSGLVRRSVRGLPPSPTSAHSTNSSTSTTESPRSAGGSAGGTRRCAVSDDEEEEDDESDESDDDCHDRLDDGRVMVKQVVTTTVTYSTPRMSLLPAPKGKRRRLS